MASQIIEKGIGFVAFPSTKLFNYKEDKKTKKKKLTFIKELLFGDYLLPIVKNNDFVRINENGKSYINVFGRDVYGYIPEKDIQPNRILEVNFIDVGQGDGCHIVSPDDKQFIVDAGASDNMFRFLKWRFNLTKSEHTPPPFTAIITHSDTDHYKGFNKLFEKQKGLKQQLVFNDVYHNGLIETSGSKVDSLGTLSPNKDYVTGLINTNSEYENFVKKVTKPGVYIKTLNKTKAQKKSVRFGSKPIYLNNSFKIEAIGPIAKKVTGKWGLPVFGSNKGKTKNGNSIVLKISYGKIKILLGGDLNSLSEDYLLSNYSKMDVAAIRTKLNNKKINSIERKKLESSLETAIIKARKYLQADIAKSCHHGSSDFTIEFLKAINATTTIISSGDEEPHCHPRPDTLGTISKYSRGERSLIYCTELARSSKEFVKLSDPQTKDKKIKAVTVYGMINVRTDGEKVIIAQKLEKKAANRSWDIHKLEWNKTTGEFEYRT